MKIYFDESGQSGCVLQKNDLLNFRTQPTFAVGALVVPTASDEEVLLEKYSRFKDKYSIQGEIKGSDLLTRARNRELSYFLKHILDGHHFFAILYDKRFYLSTLILHGMIGIEYQQEMIHHFYEQATFLSLQKDDFFLEYLRYIENPSPESFHEYLNYIINYEYQMYDVVENAVVTMATKILETHIEDKCYDDFLSFGWYENSKLTNVINLNALSELIYFIKAELNISNQSVTYIHDHILEFEETFESELKDCGIEVEFADSKDEPLLQIADNAVSILRHAYDRMITACKAERQWEETSAWDMKLLASVVNKMTVTHIKFTVPLCDWSVALCISQMFTLDYPPTRRNKMAFNIHYIETMSALQDSLTQAQRPMREVLDLLKR